MFQLTQKQRAVVEALKAVEESQTALFNAYFDAGMIDDAVEASSKRGEAYAKRVGYVYKLKQEQSKIVCSNDYCEDIAEHEYRKKAYCGVCIHEHVYDDHQPN